MNLLSVKGVHLKGIIVKALAGFYYVESEGKVYQTRARGNFRKKGQTPYVGDEVEFSAEKDSEGYILKIAERKNSLVRPPIVNIDQAVVIMSAKEPDFNPNLLDRYLVLLEQKAIHSIIYISKLDLLANDKELDVFLDIYRSIGYDTAKTITELLPFLTAKRLFSWDKLGLANLLCSIKWCQIYSWKPEKFQKVWVVVATQLEWLVFTISMGEKLQTHRDFLRWIMK